MTNDPTDMTRDFAVMTCDFTVMDHYFTMMTSDFTEMDHYFTVMICDFSEMGHDFTVMTCDFIEMGHDFAEMTRSSTSLYGKLRLAPSFRPYSTCRHGAERFGNSNRLAGMKKFALRKFAPSLPEQSEIQNPTSNPAQPSLVEVW